MNYITNVRTRGYTCAKRMKTLHFVKHAEFQTMAADRLNFFNEGYILAHKQILYLNDNALSEKTPSKFTAK